MAIQSDHEFAPTQIARAVFPTAFRGYDQDAVRRYLSRLATALEHQQEYAGLGELEARTPAHERVDDLEAEVENLRDEIKDLELELVQRSVDGADRRDERANAENEAADDATFDEHRAIELLGKETARVLESARSAASDIVKRAETQAASLKAQAKSELAEARKRSDSLVAQKQGEAEDLATKLTTEAEASAQTVTSEADEYRAAVLDESSKILTEAEELAETEQAEAEERAKQIVADAETLRQQVISELVVERRGAQSEMDRMTAARDRLAMSLAVARSELDEVADALVDTPPSTTANTTTTNTTTTNTTPSSTSTGTGTSNGNGSSAAQSDTQPQRGSGSEGPTSDGSTPDGPIIEPDLDAEVDGLIETLQSSAKPQELDLGTSEVTPKKSGSKKSRQRARKRAAQAAAAEQQKPKSDSGTVVLGANGSSAAAAETAEAKAQDDVETGASVVVDVDTKPSTESKVKVESEVAADANPATDSDLDGELDGETAAEVDSQIDLDNEIDLDSQIDLGSEVDPDDDIEVDVISVNAPPQDGAELSLVQGFTTLDISDANDDVPSQAEVIDLTQEQSALTPDDRASESEQLEDADGDEDRDLVFSVLVNEPQTPDEVITTVASRTTVAQRDRTRGDLLIDEVFTGRLPKQFAARDVALNRSGPNFRRQLRRALNDDQSDVLDRLRAGRGPIKVEELPAFGDQIDRYLAPLRRGLAEIARAGAKAGGQSDLSQSALDNLVRQLAKYIVDKVRMPTIQALEETPDNDRERILEPIRALYRDFRNIGLPDLTEDALYEAFAIGLYDSIEPAVPIRWMTDPRSDPDPVCEINRARDDIAKGEVFPSGHARPLSLPGCRCLVTVATY